MEPMRLHTLLVLVTKSGTWVRTTQLSIPPFPGLGIRLDVYDMVNVLSVVVGDYAYDVTCIVEIEGLDPHLITDQMCKKLGFEEGTYP